MVQIETSSIPDHERTSARGFVRINKHQNTWILRPGEDGMVHGEYLLCTDPSGNLPDWVINLMIHEGSVKTIQNLLSQLEDYPDPYRIANIKEK